MRAGAYARYSTDRQTDNSIAYQLGAIRDYCRREEIPIVATYTDEAQSGTNMDRAGFQEMVRDAQAGRIDTVAIYDISRGSRDVGDWFTFRKQMLTLGVKVISATGRLGDLTNPTDFITELIQTGMGQMEVLATREKSRAGVREKAEQAFFLGGVPPLGYDVAAGRYVINEAEAEVVRKIFRLYAEGHGYDAIVRALGPVLGKRGRPLGKTSLRSILRNERYIGVYTWNKRQYRILRKWAGGRPNPDVTRIEDAIPPIIDKQTWEEVQRRMEENKRQGGRSKAKTDYLLSGKIFCRSCGAAYVGHLSRNQKGYGTRYYLCGTKYRTHQCKAKNVNADDLEAFVVANLREYLRTLDYDEAGRLVAAAANEAGDDLDKARAELASVSGKIHNGVSAILSGAYVPELQEELDRLRVRKAELEEALSRARPRAPIRPEDVAAYLRQLAEGDWDAEGTRRRVRALVHRIEVQEDGSADIIIGVPGGLGGVQGSTFGTGRTPATINHRKIADFPVVCPISRTHARKEPCVMNEYHISEIVACVKEEIEELRAKGPLSEMEFGQLLAYVETLSIVQSACAGYDLNRIGLDFDIGNGRLVWRCAK